MERMSQTDRALQGLRSLVLEGEVDPGARLSEVALSERLGISRTPLRQAMDRLVAEGLLERIESGGCRVGHFTIEDITDSIELRGVIEGTAARLAAERGVAASRLRAARDVLDAIDTAICGEAGQMDFASYVRLNAQFHEQLARMAESAVVAREVDRVSRLPLASPSAFLNGQDLIPDFRNSIRRAQEQHRAILEAITNREGARAEALAREHARLARLNLDYLLSAGPGVARRVPGLALVSTELAAEET